MGLIVIYCIHGTCDAALKLERSVACKQNVAQIYNLFAWTFSSTWDDREPGEDPTSAWQGEAWCPDHLLTADDWLAVHEDN